MALISFKRVLLLTFDRCYLQVCDATIVPFLPCDQEVLSDQVGESFKCLGILQMLGNDYRPLGTRRFHSVPAQGLAINAARKSEGTEVTAFKQRFNAEPIFRTVRGTV